MIKVSNEIEFGKGVGKFLATNAAGLVDDINAWPVVYILSNNDEAYVGETTDVQTRLNQHLDNPVRRNLDSVRVISDKTFNKSVILDLESYIISHMSADSRFKKLQNGNAGQQQHNYYQREFYEAQFGQVWEELQNLGLATNSIHEIENSNLFKYSPYKALTADQYRTCFQIVEALSQDFINNRDSAFVVKGDPGTGKTVLAIYLIKLLSTRPQNDISFDDENLIESLAKIHETKSMPKIGLVISMKNLRNIIKDVFRHMGYSNIVFSPSEVANSKEMFDILIVDEAHRLKAGRNMMGNELKNIRCNNLALGLDEEKGTQLDWIFKKSHHQVLFYDANQSIKRTDVDKSHFEEALEQNQARTFTLTTQMRCGKEGNEYVDYVKAIFSDNPPTMRGFKSYDVKLFDDVKKMTDAIIEKDNDESIGLSRNVAGYAWPWHTKKKIHPNSAVETDGCIQNGDFDIEIDGNKYIWNTKYDGWVTIPNAINEVGCVHTIQGFDLNYAGVIIGPELCYDREAKRLYVKKENYCDANGKNKTDDIDLRRYILNIYKILCTRGMRGPYIYACDEGLRDYLRQFFDTEK